MHPGLFLGRWLSLFLLAVGPGFPTAWLDWEWRQLLRISYTVPTAMVNQQEGEVAQQGFCAHLHLSEGTWEDLIIPSFQYIDSFPLLCIIVLLKIGCYFDRHLH